MIFNSHLIRLDVEPIEVLPHEHFVFSSLRFLFLFADILCFFSIYCVMDFL